MLMPDIPDRPCSKLAADLLEHEKYHYFLHAVIDYFVQATTVLSMHRELIACEIV